MKNPSSDCSLVIPFLQMDSNPCQKYHSLVRGNHRGKGNAFGCYFGKVSQINYSSLEKNNGEMSHPLE